jgi:AraC family transcriptional regulator
MVPFPATHLRAHDCSLITRTSGYQANQRIAVHADVRPRLSIVVAGQLQETVGRRHEFAAAGSLVIKPGHVLHENKFGPLGARTLSIELPDWLLAEQPAELVDQWRWFHGGPVTIMATRLWLAWQEPNDHLALANQLIDVFAAASELERAGAKSVIRSGALCARTPPSWLQQVRQQLHDSSSEPCCLTALAANAGVHPVYLARLFRRYFRCSIVEYAHALRLSKVLEHMLRYPDGLALIALANGFADQSHLNRAFQRHLGLTPRRCRILLALASKSTNK